MLALGASLPEVAALTDGFQWFRYGPEEDRSPDIDRLSDGAYRALMRLYVLSVAIGPLPDHVPWLSATTRRKQKDVTAALRACFEKNTGGMWVSPWLERQRTRAMRTHRQRVEAGHASGRSRREVGQRDDDYFDDPPDEEGYDGPPDDPTP
jgi:hypothetical protein